MDRTKKKYAEAFYRLSSKIKFEEMIIGLRKSFDIDTKQPEEFLNRKLSNEEGRKWQDGVYDILFAIIPKYLHPLGDTLYSLIEAYAIKGDKGVQEFLDSTTNDHFGFLLFKSLTIKHLVEFGDRYKKGVFIYLSPYLSKSDLIDAVNLKWPEIKSYFEDKNKNDKNIKKFARVRTHVKKDRDKIIFNLYSKSRADLGLKRKDFKEIKVSSLLKREYGIDVEPENVKIIAMRLRKLKR